jgi:uncharacterized repeat protein (TIGR03803 family)
LLSSGNTLYGLASDQCGFPGTIFKLNSDGSGFTTVHTLTEGACPNGVILSGNQLYGTFSDGSTDVLSTGMVYAVNTDGTGFRNLHTFILNEGAHPNSLILLNNTLYGTTATGGTFYSGIVFAVDTNGMNFRTVYTFYGRNDGANPGGLVASGNTLYGTAYSGGTWSNGTVYAVNTDGTGFTNLHTFTATTPYNADGANPNAGLLLSGYTLYGTTYYGGSSSVGTVFSINTNSTDFRTLHSFPPANYDARGSNTNSDGAYPDSQLIISGHMLYGEAVGGGTLGSGTVFAMHTTA